MKTYNSTKKLYLEIEKIVNNFDHIIQDYEDEEESLLLESAQRSLDGLVDMLRAFHQKVNQKEKKSKGCECVCHE